MSKLNNLWEQKKIEFRNNKQGQLVVSIISGRKR